MKPPHWSWDLNLPPETITAILADEHNPRFARIAGHLLARSDDPRYVFSLMTPLAFCRRFRAMQREMDKDAGTTERAAMGRATYQRQVRALRKAGVRIRQETPRAPDVFQQALLHQLRDCRDHARLSQAELAEALGCSQQFVSGVERGHEQVTIDYLRRAAQATGCAFDIILRPRRADERQVAQEHAGLETWIAGERQQAMVVVREHQLDRGLMEVMAYLPNAVLNARQDAWRQAAGQTLQVRQQALREAMEQTQIHQFGWPIGVVMDREEFAPKPYSDGIRASILVDDTSQYDYWALRSDAVFYLLKTLFEDVRGEGQVFFDTRIVRTAETILRLGRLYQALGADAKAEVVIRIRYSGLRGRVLAAADPMRVPSPHPRTCVEDTVETSIQERLGQLEPRIVDLVHAAVCDLTRLFDYFEPSKEDVVRPLIERFLR